MILHMIHILSSNPPLYIVRSLHLIAPNEKYQVGICCVLWRVHCEACQWYWRAFWVWCLQDTWLITSTRGSWRMKINLGMLLTVCIFCPLLDCGPAPLRVGSCPLWSLLWSWSELPTNRGPIEKAESMRLQHGVAWRWELISTSSRSRCAQATRLMGHLYWRYRAGRSCNHIWWCLWKIFICIFELVAGWLSKMSALYINMSHWPTYQSSRYNRCWMKAFCTSFVTWMNWLDIGINSYETFPNILQNWTAILAFLFRSMDAGWPHATFDLVFVVLGSSRA